MGPMSQVLGMIPGFRAVAKAKDVEVDDRQLDRIEAIIHSMTRPSAGTWRSSTAAAAAASSGAAPASRRSTSSCRSSSRCAS